MVNAHKITKLEYEKSPSFPVFDDIINPELDRAGFLDGLDANGNGICSIAICKMYSIAGILKNDPDYVDVADTLIADADEAVAAGEDEVAYYVF